MVICWVYLSYFFTNPLEKVPETLAPQFLKFAAENSQRNIETCGVLFGMMIDSKIELTHVLIPKQKGTHDSCVTTNEEQILEFQGMSFITA